ncbi:MAG: MliC family protein [Pseudomonadota bacterium]
MKSSTDHASLLGDKMLRCALLLMALAVFAGCAGNPVDASATAQDFRPDDRPLAKTLVYDCNGYEFTTRLGPGEMALWLPDRYVVLSQVRSASGTKYLEGDTEFWSKGNEAMLTVGAEQYFNCVLRPERVPWEDARRRGVSFRATGNEPGWYLEIQVDKHLLFVGDYGMQRVATPYPGVTEDGDTRRYLATTESNRLEIEITDEACIDSMSGEEFPFQVTVTVNTDVYHGCGRDLEYPWQ